MMMLICPVCRSELFLDGRSLKCESRHCFDIASEGYVNLAIGKSDSGDSPEMCRARHDFLNAGYYSPLSERIAHHIKKNDAKTVCDAGCGEGYYSRSIKAFLPSTDIVGFDLAKTSIKLAAKTEKGSSFPITYAVAGIFDMPIRDECCDAVLSVFAPVPESEAHRILKDSGIMIVVHPGKNHLDGLKKLIYDNPYENDEKELSFDGFEKLYDDRVSYSATINKAHIPSLFLMTPYYWKTSKEDAEKLNSALVLNTRLDFIISVFKKI